MTDRFPSDFMADELDKLVYSKTTWLADFSQGHKKRRELAVLRQAAEDYRRAAERAA